MMPSLQEIEADAWAMTQFRPLLPDLPFTLLASQHPLIPIDQASPKTLD
jgi:hypothetical protein